VLVKGPSPISLVIFGAMATSNIQWTFFRLARVLLLIAALPAVGTACHLLYSDVPINPADVTTIVNPYGIAPLTALIVVAASSGIDEKSVHRVDVSVTGPGGRTSTWKLPYGTPRFTANFDTSDLDDVAGPDIVVPILGLVPDTGTRVSVAVFDDGARRKRVYSTVITAGALTDTRDPLRDGYPRITVSTAERSRMEPGMTLVSFSMGDNGRFVTRPFIMDAKGRMRWLLRLDALRNWASPVERLQNGNLAFGRGGYVYEYSMLGRQLHAWDIGQYGYTQHHDVFEIRRGPRRGDLLVAVDRRKSDTVEDAVIEIDRKGALVDTWDLRKLLDVSRGNILKNKTDWLHMNAIVYDPRDDSILISGRNQGVAKVGRAHELQWILAPHEGWGKAGDTGEGADTAGYLLTAVSRAGKPYPEEVQRGLESVDGGVAFDWPWGQHSILLMGNGNLFMFDNGFNRNFKGNPTGFSRAVEYHIDEHAKTVSQVWQYGASRGSDYYSDIISDVDILPRTRHRLITSGSVRHSMSGPHAYVTEITYPEAKTVFEARLGFRDAHSNLKAGGWGNIDIVYRAERLPLYPGIPREVR
jgi:arylsulfate sulfotransferase